MSDPILEAALGVLGDCGASTDGGPCGACRRRATEAVDAVRPLIEAEVRERIARDIEAVAARYTGQWAPATANALAVAGGIARGSDV